MAQQFFFPSNGGVSVSRPLVFPGFFFCRPKVDINFCSILLFSSSFSQRQIYNCIYVNHFFFGP